MGNLFEALATEEQLIEYGYYTEFYEDEDEEYLNQEKEKQKEEAEELLQQLEEEQFFDLDFEE